LSAAFDNPDGLGHDDFLGTLASPDGKRPGETGETGESGGGDGDGREKETEQERARQAQRWRAHYTLCCDVSYHLGLAFLRLGRVAYAIAEAEAALGLAALAADRTSRRRKAWGLLALGLSVGGREADAERALAEARGAATAAPSRTRHGGGGGGAGPGAAAAAAAAEAEAAADEEEASLRAMMTFLAAAVRGQAPVTPSQPPAVPAAAAAAAARMGDETFAMDTSRQLVGAAPAPRPPVAPAAGVVSGRDLLVSAAFGAVLAVLIWNFTWLRALFSPVGRV